MRVKKLISSILVVVMLLATVITVNASSFKDIKSSDWFYSSVNYVADKGIMQGTSSTKFEPKTNLSRAMGVTLLYRVAGNPSVSGITLPFNDVKGGQWYTDAVKWAYKNGIVTGKTKTSFATNDNITRAEFATILNRYSDFMKYRLPVNRADTVADSSKIPDWAFMAVWNMYRAEIINGRSGGIFDPDANITRAEAAAMIERFMKAPKDGSSNGGNANPETQPPVEDPDIPTTGKLVIKEKKYDYNGANVMILDVENQSDKNINLTINVKYQDGSGKTLKTETRKIEGFPANYRNYVIFNPGIKFDKFTFEVKTSAFSGEALMKYVNCSNDVEIIARPSIQDSNEGRDPRAELKVIYRVISSYPKDIYYSAHFALFDKNGDLFYVYTGQSNFLLGEYPVMDNGNRPHIITYDNIMYKDYVMPDVLNGKCTGIVALVGFKDHIG